MKLVIMGNANAFLNAEIKSVEMMAVAKAVGLVMKGQSVMTGNVCQTVTIHVKARVGNAAKFVVKVAVIVWAVTG